MPMKKTKSFIYFEMLEEGYKFEKLFSLCFQVENKVQICTKYIVYTHWKDLFKRSGLFSHMHS
jgi:hypothetical protein